MPFTEKMGSNSRSVYTNTCIIYILVLTFSYIIIVFIYGRNYFTSNLMLTHLTGSSVFSTFSKCHYIQSCFIRFNNNDTIFYSVFIGTLYDSFYIVSFCLVLCIIIRSDSWPCHRVYNHKTYDSSRCMQEVK